MEDNKYIIAFERAESAYGTGAYDDATLEFIFPELMDSEDERIRKEILHYFKTCHCNGENVLAVNCYPKEWIDWLEKQKSNNELCQDRQYCNTTNNFGDKAKYDTLISAVGYLKSNNKITPELSYMLKQYLEQLKNNQDIIDKINKYIDDHTCNAHEMPWYHKQKKYCQGVDDTLSDIAGIINQN